MAGEIVVIVRPDDAPADPEALRGAVLAPLAASFDLLGEHLRHALAAVASAQVEQVRRAFGADPTIIQERILEPVRQMMRAALSPMAEQFERARRGPIEEPPGTGAWFGRN